MDGPIIVQVGVYNKSTTAAFIDWTTDIESTSRVDIGTTTSYGTNVTDSAYLTVHGLQITSLTVNTTYHYKVTSVDKGGNSVSSPDSTFATRASSYLPGDVNNDGVVDIFDVSIIAIHYGQSGRTLSQGNTDDDPNGVVDDMDIYVASKNFT